MTNNEQPTSLGDKKWFENVHFKEQDTLSSTSEIKLPLLRLLCHLSFLIELLFTVALITLSLVAALWLVDSYGVAGLVVYLPLLIGTLLLKRILIWRKFGFSSKHVMTISKEKIEVNPFINDSLKQSRLFKRDDIESVLFNYNLINHVSDTQTQVNAALNRAFIKLKTGENIDLNVNRVGLFNVLYLLYHFDYPLIYKKSFDGGGSSVGYLFLRVSGVLANLPVIAMYFFS
ncbi:hypothetical protein KDW99_11055 [Marinomonas rhizomae]|uniref:hypothetical protein n=1 Tax=Marinomonas rhizomae TaxID=491948 RepID=UPI002107F8E2|nr:hypothetical protein [Marinomonas rhizomae]UTV97839.1 hypothetical protein KDW99_11055 [Marinomonas rhizomae]